jgi:hypothetical protein
VAGKDLRDQPPARSGQRDHDESPIVAPAHLLDEAAAGEIGHDDRDVAVAAQQLRAQVALAQRPVVQQRLQHAELADREAGRRHHGVHPGGDGLGRPHQLDVRVEGGGLGGAPGIAGRHGSNLNGLYAPRPGLSSKRAPGCSAHRFPHRPAAVSCDA